MGYNFHIAVLHYVATSLCFDAATERLAVIGSVAQAGLKLEGTHTRTAVKHISLDKCHGNQS